MIDKKSQVPMASIEATVAKNMDKLSEGSKLGITLVAPVFPHGGNWGFIENTDPDFAAKLEELRTESRYIKLIRVSNGAVVLVKEDFLAYNVNLLVPNAIGRPFAEEAVARHNTEKERFGKFLANVLKGESKHLKRHAGYAEFTLGVFSMNETLAIRVNNVDYPAYKLSAIEALMFLDSYGRTHGRQFYVQALREDGSKPFVPVFEAGGSTAGQAAFQRTLEISPTGTGVFMNVRIK